MLLTSCSVTNKTTQLQTQSEDVVFTQVSSDTIPFEISKANNIIFKTVLNGTDSLHMYFDTGGTEVVLLHEIVKEKTTLLQSEAADYQPEVYEPLKKISTLSIGGLSWDSLTIYPVPIGPDEADGHFGWNLFENKIVELNYDQNWMVVHSDAIPIPNGFSKLEIEYTHTLFCVQGSAIVEGKTYTNRYLFDTGFQRAIVLDKDLRKEEKFPTDLPVIKESKLRNSEGTVFINKVVISDQFCLDKACAPEVPTQLFNTPNPARFKTHILGNEILKRFNTILDFQNDVIYLKPNGLIDLPYADAG